MEQLLTLARLEPDQVGGRSEPCELRALAHQTIAELAPAALARNVEVELAEGGPAAIDGDPELLSVLLGNLVDNAVRYGPAGGAVRVELASARDTASISVTDEGPGIAPQERANVGRRFYRILGSDATGSGLGLSIVLRIAEIHGAAVALGEGAGGKGLRVTVSFRGRNPRSREVVP